jgi:hypothetical protein
MKDDADERHTTLARGSQRIRADPRVHTAPDVLFRFYVHTPGKSLSVIDRETEVEDAVSRLRSLRSLRTTNVRMAMVQSGRPASPDVRGVATSTGGEIDPTAERHTT